MSLQEVENCADVRADYNVYLITYVTGLDSLCYKAYFNQNNNRRCEAFSVQK